MKISKTHPRYTSLIIRSRIEEGVRSGITSYNGLIAHGRGEAFDYLLGEKTHDFAKEAIQASAAMLLLAKHPAISVNGNTAALVPEETITLASLLHASLEINLFHSSEERLQKIKKHLEHYGGKDILLPDHKTVMPHIASARKYVNPEGIYKADVVFVPLEDGDRAEALMKNGKEVITIDLNPLSRTAQTATVTIVDNIVRAMPLLLEEMKMKGKPVTELKNIVKKYDNRRSLKAALKKIQTNLE